MVLCVPFAPVSVVLLSFQNSTGKGIDANVFNKLQKILAKQGLNLKTGIKLLKN